MSDWSVTNNAWIQIWRVIIDKIGLTATFAALPPQFRGWLSVVVITLLARLVTKKEEQIFQFQFLQLYSTNWQDNAFKVTLNGAQWAEGSARPALGLIGGPPQFRHRGSKSKNSKKKILNFFVKFRHIDIFSKSFHTDRKSDQCYNLLMWWVQTSDSYPAFWIFFLEHWLQKQVTKLRAQFLKSICFEEFRCKMEYK